MLFMVVYVTREISPLVYFESLDVVVIHFEPRLPIIFIFDDFEQIDKIVIQ